MPTRFFGLFMSVHPVFAAITGLIFLSQRLAGHEWLGMAIVISVNAASVIVHALDTARGRGETPVRAETARRLRPGLARVR